MRLYFLALPLLALSFTSMSMSRYSSYEYVSNQPSSFERVQQGTYGFLKGILGTWVAVVSAGWMEKTIDSIAGAYERIGNYNQNKRNNYRYTKPSLTNKQVHALANANTFLAKGVIEAIKPLGCAAVTACVGYIAFKILRSAYRNLHYAAYGYPAGSSDKTTYVPKEVVIVDRDQTNSYHGN